MAREGYPFIGIGFGVLGLFGLAGWWLAALLWLPVALWVVAFFRDLARNSDPAEGHAARQGERLSLIRFGSRVDPFLPPNAKRQVQPGDFTKAGETVGARW